MADEHDNYAVGLRWTSGAFLAELRQSWNDPDWFLAGTSLQASGDIPERITVNDYLCMIGNIFEFSPNRDYFVDYLLAGVPLYRGGLDLGMQSAPHILAALKLVASYANDRPGYHYHLLIETDQRTGLQLQPTVELGRGMPILTEVPLLFLLRMMSRNLGRPASEAVIELAYPAPSYADRVISAFSCNIRYGSKRSAITVPAAVALQPSKTFDGELWRIAGFRCREEQRQRAGEDLIVQVAQKIADFKASNGKVPTLAEVATAFGLSDRTLVRRLRQQDQTYQHLIDEFLKHRCLEYFEGSEISIADIAERLGFADPSSFYRSFRRWTGRSPGEYRSGLMESKRQVGS